MAARHGSEKENGGDKEGPEHTHFHKNDVDVGMGMYTDARIDIRPCAARAETWARGRVPSPSGSERWAAGHVAGFTMAFFVAEGPRFARELPGGGGIVFAGVPGGGAPGGEAPSEAASRQRFPRSGFRSVANSWP